MIRGLFFDLGGTLYSYNQYPSIVRRIAEQVRQLHALDGSEADIAAAFLAATKSVDQRYAEKTFYLFIDYFSDIFRDFFQMARHACDERGILACARLLEGGLVAELKLKDDCLDTLRTLQASGLYMSIVSNSDREQLRALVERAQLAPYFHHITSSEEAGSCKPDQQFFEEARKKSGLAPEEILFIGDSIEQDIAGASLAGFYTALITEPGITPLMHVGKARIAPHFNITHLGELVPLLRRINTGVG